MLVFRAHGCFVSATFNSIRLKSLIKCAAPSPKLLRQSPVRMAVVWGVIFRRCAQTRPKVFAANARVASMATVSAALKMMRHCEWRANWQAQLAILSLMHNFNRMLCWLMAGHIPRSVHWTPMPAIRVNCWQCQLAVWLAGSLPNHSPMIMHPTGIR